MTRTTSREISSLARILSNPRGFGDQSLVSTHPDAIRLLGGIPAPDALPLADFESASTRLWSDHTAAVAALQYSSSLGFDGLRTWIAEREGVDAQRVMITNGGMHGLSLSVLGLVERGSAVAVDNPIFPLFLRVLELSDAPALPIPVRDDGLDVEYLDWHLSSGARVSAVYTVPDFHNPSQGTLSREKRIALIALAEKHEFVILADNPYRELRFDGVDQGYELFNESDRVVHVNTFTKTLGPGLRLGWLVLPAHLVDPISKIRNRVDSHSSTLVQTLVQSLVTSSPEWFDETMQRARALYRHRAHLLIDALHAELPGQFETRAPEGGLFLWPKILDPSVDPRHLYERARASGVEYQQGEFFASGPNTESARHLRLAYGDRTDDDIALAVERLASAWS